MSAKLIHTPIKPYFAVGCSYNLEANLESIWPQRRREHRGGRGKAESVKARKWKRTAAVPAAACRLSPVCWT